MSKIINVLSILIIFSLVGFAMYQVYDLTPTEHKSLKIISEQVDYLPETNASKNLTQFLPNMRFATNNISYTVLSDCDQEKKEKVEKAFQIIENETTEIHFYEKNYEKAQIKVSCSQEKKESSNNSFIAGEGGPSRMLNLTLYPLILEGEVFLYRTIDKKDCNYPAVEVHEILHVLGFNHIANENSVLYPYTSCSQKITPEMISEINRIYKIEPKAELEFKKVNLSKGGSYLNFKAEFTNLGLITSQETQLKIIDEERNKTIKIFDMQEIAPGITKTLTIENLKLENRNTPKIILLLETATPEYFYENNKIEGILE